jgi:CheY-like chemotaxis protein
MNTLGISAWLWIQLCCAIVPASHSKRRRPLRVYLGFADGQGTAPTRPYLRVSYMLNVIQIAANEIQPNIPLGISDDLPAARGTILVVEDEAFVREAACDILEGEGYRVLRARNAAEAHAAFCRQETTVQLLLSDVVLPDQNGPALAKAMQAACPTLKVVFISGYPLNTVTRYGLKAGQMSYLPKPFSAMSLLGKVKQVLESKEEACP